MDALKALLAVTLAVYAVGWTSQVIDWYVPEHIVRSSPGIYQSTQATSQITVNPYRGRATFTVTYLPALIIKFHVRGHAVRVAPNAVVVKGHGRKALIRCYGNSMTVKCPHPIIRPFISRPHPKVYTYTILESKRYSVYFNRSGYLLFVRKTPRSATISALPLIPLV